ncbi:MAG: hypothetical protein KBT46_01260 [Ruminococcus sp.]|nr:hypothetical protein [Candidatus Copronaster equi]
MEISELAKSYCEEAERLKDKIEELKNTKTANQQELNHKIVMYESMYEDCVYSFNLLKDYYDS